MKKIIIIISILAVFATPSCKEYLNVVPDDVETLETLFASKESAWDALAKIYSYLPIYLDSDISPWLLGDEYFGKKLFETNSTKYLGMRIMRGFQNENSPILGYWSGTYCYNSMYEGIRQCNIFMDNIHRAANMLENEKEDWYAQAKFLRAYYHFLLIQRYGPVVIRDGIISLEATKEELYVQRSKIEDCFNFVIQTMDEAIPYLQGQKVLQDAGQIDQVGARAIKARVLLFRASPFFNGNSDYYASFKDHDGKHFFPQTYNKEKWKDVIIACDKALETCEEWGKGLYKYIGEEYYKYDRDALDRNPERMKTLHNLRTLITTPWSKELLWGYTRIRINNGDSWGEGRNMIHSRSQIRAWEVMPAQCGYTQSYWGDNDDCENHANQQLCATYAMLERYYTEKGLPLNADYSYNPDNRYTTTVTPLTTEVEYDKWAGIMQPDMETMYLYMNRELRFYANLGITGGYWRGHYTIIPFNPYLSTAKDVPLNRGTTRTRVYQFGGKETWRKKEDYFETCIGIQKFVHPESYSGNWTRLQRYPYPIIRYADLLLMKAEALNEYYEGPDPEGEVFNLLNQVRERAGIPTVQESWTSEFCRTPGRHLEYEGLREIILQERGIELAFEGSRFEDMIRHKRAADEFSRPVMGWDPDGTDIEGQMGAGPKVKQYRKFSIANCLWPIDIGELNIQGTLKQNPGWR